MKNGNGRIKRLIAGGLVGLVGLTFAPSVADAAISTATFCASVPTGQSGFTDIAQAGVHQRNVECLKASGITSGTTATTYSPQANVTRGQMATFIANAIDLADRQDAPGGATVPTLPTAAASQDRFTDDETSVHEGNINRLAQANVVRGTTATTFSPDANVTREQMASFIAQAHAFITGTTLPEGSDQFTDDENSVHEANINRIANADIVDGTGARGGKATYGGALANSRAQMASQIMQLLAFLHSQGVITALNPAGGGNAPATTRPELTGAVLGATVPGSQANPGNPQGTRITLTFDETISSIIGAGMFAYEANPAIRHVCDVNPGSLFGIRSDRTQVLVNCPTVDNDAERNNLVLFGIDEGTVSDFQGQTNIIGDAAIGTSSSSQSAAGITSAPDVQAVVGTRQANAGANTIVDVQFDEAAFIQNNTGIHIVGLNGLDVTCTGPGVGSNSPGSGGTVPGGNGTTVISVLCPTSGLGNGTTFNNTDFARVFVLQGTVGDASGGGNLNPLQAADVAASGNTTEPDLVSATFQPDATIQNGGVTTQVDAVVYQFENNIAAAPGGAPDATAFQVYDSNGVQTEGLNAGNPNAGNTGPTVSQDAVRVIFPDGTLATAVGASVDDSAVNGAQGANEEDEVAVSNSFAIGITPGLGPWPQLTSVNVLRPPSNFPNQESPFVIVYVFDERINAIVQTGFFAYRSNGQRLVSDTCAIGTTTETNNTVTCSGFDLDNAGGTQATSDQIGSAVVGAVDDNGAFTGGSATGLGATNDFTREDAQRANGGTGTAAS